MWIDKVYEMLKAPLRTVFALLLFSSSIMIFPDNLLEILGLSTFSKNNRPYLGIIFVLSLSLLATDLFGHLGKRSIKYFKNIKLKKRLIAQIGKLSQYEKKLISNMFNEDGYTILLDLSDGKYTRLENLGFIFRSSSVSDTGQYGEILFAHTLQPWLSDYLAMNPQKLKELL